ncbi:MAG: hypothetical protein P4L22_05340 [Candidatus Babeliales bacterium]|nr:hypothetical protein [Candidatus Babeliales bacterium]
MKNLFIFLYCFFSTICLSSELQTKQTFFKSMKNYTQHCNECALHKMLVKMISTLSAKCGKKDEYELRFEQELSKVDPNNFKLSQLCNIEIISIIELTEELTRTNNIDFGAFKDLQKILKATLIKLIDEANMRYEYALVHIKNKCTWNLADMLKFIIKCSKKLEGTYSKPYELIIFESLLFQMNKHMGSSQHCQNDNI